MQWSIVDQVWDQYQAHGDVEMLREDILTSPWYQEPDDANDCLLMRAIEAFDVKAVRMLLSMGESPSKPFRGGFGPSGNLMGFAKIPVFGVDRCRTGNCISRFWD